MNDLNDARSVMAKHLGGLMFVCSLFAASGALFAAVTNTFVYTAAFGKFDGSGEVVQIGITTNVSMTVALYDNEQSGARPLWCRRLTVPVWGGRFAVELDDALGTGDATLAQPPRYQSLTEAFANASPDAAWWVGILNPRVGDTKPAGVTEDAPLRGKLSAVPFAFEAERASGARGNFRVAGTATVGKLRLEGDLAVTGCAAFGGDVAFREVVKFGGESVNVTGTFACPDLEDVEAVRATTLNVSKGTTADAVVLTDGTATTLVPDSSGLSSLKRVTADALDVAGKFEASEVAAETVEIGGTLTLGYGASIVWESVDGQEAMLEVPNGVYSDTVTLVDDISSPIGDKPIPNTTGKDVLGAFAVAAHAQQGEIRVETSAANDVWARVGAASGGTASISVTVLSPMAPADAGRVSGMTSLVHSYKELSK